MKAIGYHASHEQFSPSELVKLSCRAQQAGFGFINSSDHFHPWSEKQGQCGFSFAWLGAAMSACHLPFSMVCAPGQRYHPAIVAQALATLAELFPGRLTAALGSGEAINESITGDKWPLKEERNERLKECYEIINRLLKGEVVTHRGRVIVEHAKLYTLPAENPDLLIAALSEETAAWAGSWAPGLLTAHKPMKELRKVLDAFRTSGGKNKTAVLKVQISYAREKHIALEGAYDQWRTNILPGTLLADLSYVGQFDTAATYIKKEDMENFVHISTDPKFYAGLLHNYFELGFDRIILHNVNRDQELFITDFGEKILPLMD